MDRLFNIYEKQLLDQYPSSNELIDFVETNKDKLYYRRQQTGDTIIHILLKYVKNENYLIQILLLLSNYMNFNYKNSQSQTPLSYAIINNYNLTILLLLLNNTTITEKDNMNNDILHLAIQYRCSELVKIICSKYYLILKSDTYNKNSETYESLITTTNQLDLLPHIINIQ